VKKTNREEVVVTDRDGAGDPDKSAQKSNRVAYLRILTYGGLALDTLLLAQFITINRDVLTASSSGNDVGLTIIGYIPTAQVILCGLALSTPSLAFLAICYTELVPLFAYLPRFMEVVFFQLGLWGVGIALLATFWFFSLLATVVFMACLFVIVVGFVFSLLNMVVSRRSRKARINRPG
jgi:hypothetical protein